MAMKQYGNPVIRHVFTADPTVLVYRDTLYLFTGHDEPPAGVDDYVMNDWLCFSSNNLLDWEAHPSPLKATDFTWASGGAFATKIVAYDHKFYWFVSVNHAGANSTALGLAVATHPMGPFHDVIGSALVTHDMLPQTDNAKANLDPSVLIDDNGEAFLFWGNGTCYFAKLKPDLKGLEGAIRVLDLPGFSEGAHIHKKNGIYYLCYGYGHPEKVAYAVSSSIEGPWQFIGILNELAGNCETNRPAIIDFKGKSYFFYHNGALPGGGSHRRSVCIDNLSYNGDGTIRRVVMSSEGVRGAGTELSL